MVLATHLIHRYVTNDILKISDLGDFSEGPVFGKQALSDVGHTKSLNDFLNIVSELASENDRNNASYDRRHDRLAFCCFAYKAREALDQVRGVNAEPEETMTEANSLYDRIVGANCQTAEAVFKIIEECWLADLTYLEPIEEDEDDKPAKTAGSAGAHYVPEKLKEYLPPDGPYQSNRNPADIREIAELVLRQFETVGERLALISGKVNAGKSGCIVELLRSLHEPGRTTIGASLKPPGSGEPILLPVFTVSVQDHTGYEMLLMVLAFLERVVMTPGKQKAFDFEQRVKQLSLHYGDELRAGAVDAVKAKIRELHASRPALFILTSWEDLTWSTPRAQLRDQTKASLIALLHDSNRISRFVITTTSTPNARAKRVLPKYKRYTINDPGLQHINRYLPGLEYPECYKQALFDAMHRLAGVTVPGDHLILIASALELCRNDEIWERHAIEALEQLTPEHYKVALVAPPHQFVKLLVERLNDRDLFRIIMAIMASEDGLRPSSLYRLMEEWDRDAERTLNRVGTAIDTGLKGVSKLANSFFLRKRRINPISVNQFSPLEEEMANEESWEIYETLRQTILTALTDPDQQQWAEPYSRLLREATRHVAKLAFGRAQEWRARTVYANLTPWWQDLLLDIQALEALLASIDPDGLVSDESNRAQRKKFPLLHHATDAIFTCRSNHAPAVAVRFAVLTLLSDTVDVDNRMSMCYDQDLMRMGLYMLPFLGVGRRHFGRLDDKALDDLPKTIPTWMRSVFSDEEIFRLLEAVAISALHSQAADVVRWAWERTGDLIETAVLEGANRQDLIFRTVRTYCSTIDMAIQRGLPLDDKKATSPTRNGHERTLDQVKQFLEEAFPDQPASDNAPADDFEAPSDQHDLIEAIGRLRVRRAHLQGLLGHLDAAEEEFAVIHAWEMALARTRGHGRPEVLEGRPARVALQLLMRGELLLKHSSEKREDISKRIRGMLSANNARLARFGGAEQAAMLVDRSRFAFVNGDFELAYKYAAEARQFCDDNRVSYGMQIHILLNLVAILIECSEGARTSGAEDRLLNRDTIELAERDADAVYQTAKALALKPTEGIALYLRARLQHMRTVLHPELDPNAGRRDTSKKDIGDAIVIMQKCADRSFRQGMERLRDLIAPIVTG
ncbi:hypothetical protein [Rhizobium leguminosarum]|uniref:hypothetical protein n=1 Tax=Rhizobium leguminosarum TaxID=384 RepID=UPI001F370699|nr:hypothetical protein [Rhizobium leguminosarum]UIJ82429.1 hypothetical protein LZK78_24845 [Rhizobium leguminosarum]